jgi:acyl-coenzyme A synthetase/AMP-(fatty) acid ligase
LDQALSSLATDDPETHGLTIPQFLQPHEYSRTVEFVRDIPKTGTGKIDRQALSRATGHEGDQP